MAAPRTCSADPGASPTPRATTTDDPAATRTCSPTAPLNDTTRPTAPTRSIPSRPAASTTPGPGRPPVWNGRTRTTSPAVLGDADESRNETTSAHLLQAEEGVHRQRVDRSHHGRHLEAGPALGVRLDDVRVVEDDVRPVAVDLLLHLVDQGVPLGRVGQDALLRVHRVVRLVAVAAVAVVAELRAGHDREHE